jgi:two-component system, OmpR family, phosphate regulon sensor histidine kinase PhoR
MFILESKHHPFEMKHYRLDTQLRNVILASEPHWLEKTIEMDISLEPIIILADEELLGQVWVNLLHNSIKFTPAGGTITVAAQKNRSEVQVRISDTGIGIAKEDQARIFERFFKADKSRNRTSGGSGLGLSIVKKIVGTHNGRISVESSVGKGTIMIVSLPIGE